MRNQKEMQQNPLNILILGKNSYLGVCTDHYLREYNKSLGNIFYHINRLSQRSDAWKNYDFSGYDTVICMTGIAHVDLGRITAKQKQLYYRINCDLAVEAARKARKEGVRQFIYMSSVLVHGDGARVGKSKHISADTPERPSNYYGSSKLKAERKLAKLAAEDFQIAIVRAPMVYGAHSKGNFPILRKLAEHILIFPTISNQRSMIYVENLAEFLRILADSGEGGIFYPQNTEYVATYDIVCAIANAAGKRITPCAWLNLLVKLGSYAPGKIGKLVNKAFGSLTIDQALSRRSFDGYCNDSLEASIKKIYQNR